MSAEFLARIKLIMEGDAAVATKIANTKAQLQGLGGVGTASSAQIRRAMGDLGKETTASTGPVKKMMDLLGRAAMVAPLWMAVRGAIMGVQNVIRDQIRFTLELEDAMARIQIVGKGTAAEYENLKYSLLGLSLAYGISSSEAMKAAVVFAQQGKTVAETFDLTKIAMMGAQVLGQDVKTTVEDLTAAMNAYNIPVTEAVSILDKFVAVEKNFAVTSQDLSNGVKTVGATAKQVGVSLSALSGDIAAVIEVTRKSGSEAARGLAFMYARLLTSGRPVIEQLTGIKFYMDEAGNSTSDLTGKLRSATDILDDLAAKWADLGNEQRIQAAKALGSVRQMVVINALMDNYQTSIDARIVALTSAGQAEKSLAILMETSSYKAKQLAAAMNTLTLSFADTSVWKKFLDGLGATLLGYATFINYQKGARAIQASITAGIIAQNDTRNSQISAVEELIELEKKLAAQPKTVRTDSNLKLIRDEISKVQESFPKLKIAIEGGSKEEVRAVVEKYQDDILEQNVRAKVDLEFNVVFEELEMKKAALKSSLENMAPIGIKLGIVGGSEKNQILEIEKKKTEQTVLQTAEYNKQLKTARTQAAMDRAKQPGKSEQEVEDELNILLGNLTAKEEERFTIAEDLNKAKEFDLLTETELIELEIKRVNNSTKIYDAHEKTVKLRELEGKLLSSIKNDDEKLISHELELLRIRGASESQLFKAETALKAQLLGLDKVTSSEEYRLELIKQQTKEKMDQDLIGQDSTKLWKLAEKYGTEAAKQVGQLLMAPDTYRMFERNATPQAKTGFADIFSDKAEQYKAQQFYALGLYKDQTYGAGGRNIPIPERDLVQEPERPIIRLPNGMWTQGAVPAGIATAKTSPTGQVSISTVQLNLTAPEGKTKEERLKNLAEAMTKALTENPKIIKAVEDIALGA